MGYYDELDHEIDREMGWDRGAKGARGKGKSPRRGPDYWHALLRTAKASSPLFRGIKRVARAIGKVIFFPVISPMAYARHMNPQGDMVVVKRSLFWRIADGIMTRVLLTPVILAIFFIAMVYASTHPRQVQAISTPEAVGVYFKRVSMVTVDNQRLAGWYLPPINADDVAFDPEGSLIQKWPGVVVVHGLGQSHDMYLPLAKELHAAGFAVLMLDMRGQGESDPAAVTYGLREKYDVLAGVKLLRETPYVDETRVAVVGHDIGATAALQAAALDSSIKAVVVDGLWPKFQDRARDSFSRPPANSDSWAAPGGRLPTGWMAPLYTMTFEISVRDRLSQLDPEASLRNIHTQPVLFVSRSGPEFAPVQDILGLADSPGGGKREVFIDNPQLDGDAEKRMREFLMQSTGWKGAKARGAEQIEKLFQSEVKK